MYSMSFIIWTGRCHREFTLYHKNGLLWEMSKSVHKSRNFNITKKIHNLARSIETESWPFTTIFSIKFVWLWKMVYVFSRHFPFLYKLYLCSWWESHVWCRTKWQMNSSISIYTSNDVTEVGSSSRIKPKLFLFCNGWKLRF